MRCRAGFSLLEAVFALAILGLASVTMLATLGADLRAAERAQRSTEAASLAADRLERIRILPADALRPLADSLARGAFERPLDGYRWRSTVRPVRDEPDLVEVHVRIDWASGSYGVQSRLYRPRPRFGAP
jgi:Tfp pilus assembly protein PilV